MKKIGWIAGPILFTHGIIALTFSLSYASVTLSVGWGSGHPGSVNNPVVVSLDNTDRDSDPDNNKVKALQMKICDEDGYLACTACAVTERTAGFSCLWSDPGDGCCQVTLFTVQDETLIEEGTGPVFTVRYSVAGDAPRGDCVALAPEEVMVSDMMNAPLEVLSEPGALCILCASDLDCEDDLFCTGEEICEDGFCVHSGNPCPAGTVCNEANDTCDVQIPPECEVRITPSTATVTSGANLPLLASTSGEASCAPGDYEWSISTQIGSMIDQDEGYYTAGSNTTGVEITDTITVVDHANLDISSSASIRVRPEGVPAASLRVFPGVLLASRWIPIPYLLIMTSQEAVFQLTSNVSFEPLNDINPLFQIGFRNIFFALVMLNPDPPEGTVAVTITTAEEIAVGEISIRLFPLKEGGCWH